MVGHLPGTRLWLRIEKKDSYNVRYNCDFATFCLYKSNTTTTHFDYY